MTAIPLGVSAFHRTVAKTPNILLRNMVLEKDPSNLVDGMLRIQRAGLESFAAVALGPGRAIYQQDGTFGGDWLVVSGPSLYRVTDGGLVTGIGTVSGSDICEIAASPTRAIIVSHGTAYSTMGTGNLSTIAVPDIDGVKSHVSSVAYINGYFILCVKDSHRFFWIAPGETNPQPLNFASAENTPDNLVAAAHVFDELWLLGTSSIEIWQPTGDNDLPFERINGRIYEKGCASRDTIREVDNTLFWVGADGIVYRGDSSPARISDNSIEEHIRLNTSGGLRAWDYALDGHLFYVLTVGTTGTFAFDVSTQSWTQFSSYNREAWRAHLGRQSDAQTVLAIDDTTGDIWRLSTAISNDNGTPMVRELAGGVAVIGKSQVCSNIEIVGAMGNAPITGTAADPKVMLRWSDDFGRTWGAWREMQIGKQGQYFKRAILRRLGTIRPPGRVFQFRFTDDTLFRVSYARLNEAVV